MFNTFHFVAIPSCHVESTCSTILLQVTVSERYESYEKLKFYLEEHDFHMCQEDIIHHCDRHYIKIHEIYYVVVYVELQTFPTVYFGSCFVLHHKDFLNRL